MKRLGNDLWPLGQGLWRVRFWEMLGIGRGAAGAATQEGDSSDHGEPKKRKPGAGRAEGWRWRRQAVGSRNGTPYGFHSWMASRV